MQMLYFLLFLLIPILIHLFNFRRFKTLYFSNTIFLKTVNQITKSTKKLKNIIILFIRILTFIFLVLAFSGLHSSLKNENSNFESNIIYIDNSYSTQAMGMNGNLFSEAKELAKQIVTDAPIGSEFIVLSNYNTSIDYRTLSKIDALDKIDYLDYSSINKSFQVLFTEMQRNIFQKNKNKSHRIFSISDYCSNNFKESQNMTLNDSLNQYNLFNLNAQNSKNIYIDSVWFNEPLVAMNRPLNLMVKIVNNANEEIKNLPITLKLDEIHRQALVNIDAKSNSIIQFNYNENSTGWKSGVIEINDENIFFDDSYFMGYEVLQEINILLIENENSSDRIKLVYDSDSIHQLKTINPLQLQPDDFIQSDLIIFNGIQEFSLGLNAIINEIYANSKSILIIPSSNIDLPSYNNLFGNLNLPKISKLNPEAVNINEINLNDYFFKGIFDSDPKEISIELVKEYFQLNLNANSNYIPLINFENDDILLLKDGTKGQIFLLTSPVDKSNETASNHILFSSMLLRVAEICKGRNHLSFNMNNNTPVTIKKLNKNEVLKITNNEIEFIPQSYSNGFLEQLSIEPESNGLNLKAGCYDIKNQDQTLRKIGLNFDRNESNITYLSKNEIIENFQKMGVQNLVINDHINLQQGIVNLEKDKNNYWRFLLISALILLLIEMIINFKTGRLT